MGGRALRRQGAGGAAAGGGFLGVLFGVLLFCSCVFVFFQGAVEAGVGFGGGFGRPAMRDSVRKTARYGCDFLFVSQKVV